MAKSTIHDHMHSAAPRPSIAKRPKYRAARAFYIFLFIGTCFAAYSLLTHPYAERQSPPQALYARDLDQPISSLGGDEECRLVHKAKDQCAYIRAHCPDDEGGFTAYLELYFCRLKTAKPVAFIILISWLGLLFSTIGIAASDFFCIDLSTIAGILGMSESVAGVTFLAFGNGSPDVFSTFAAMSTDSGSLAVGELFGAAGFITAVVAGSMALIRPFHVAKKSFIRDVGFFTVAAAFSMVFLWDGHLHFWECATMVIYYILYVAFVVGWHWWLGRRRRRREKDAAVRGHFIPVEDELGVEEEEPYQDDPEETAESRRPSLSRGASREDWAALEGGSARLYNDGNEDDEEEARDRWMSELASNMRLTRPTRSRKNTVTAVRPSLVGALEFQAVLKSLQKSRNIQTIPMDSRRYSDDPTYTTAQQQDQLSSVSDPATRPPYEILITDEENTTPTVQTHIDHPTLEIPQSAPAGRTRAVSVNDAAALRVNTDLQRLSPVQSDDNLIDLGKPGHRKTDSLAVPTLDGGHALKSPVLTVEPATPRREVPVRRPRSKTDARPRSSLLTPEDARGRPGTSDYFTPRAPSRHGTDSPPDDPSQPARVPSARTLPKIIIPGKDRSPGSSRSTSPFPAYRDFPSPSVTGSDRSPLSTGPPSIYLPGPELSSVASPESIAADDSAEQERPRRPDRLARIWPYKILPPPGVMISTLFPTIYHWHEKTWWEKCLGVVAAPSVFCLTITLPVVENDKESERSDSVSEHPHKDVSWDSARSKSTTALQTPGSGGIKGLSPEWMHDPDTPHPHSIETDGVAGMGNSASVAVHAEQHYRNNYGTTGPHHASISGEPQAMDHSIIDDVQEKPELWNRWLTLVQLFTAPVFIVLSIYLQAPDGLSTSWLIRAILISLAVSAVLLVPILLTTTPTHRPEPYRIILSLAGFVVAIAWISAIAAQVVGALKALAVILNMSHAIMGLTIFAVGNSLGDLVADVTVAKLGYPVMALSACFGGPMLNILLGVGLSGSYILIKGAERRHEKHPGKGIKFRSYHMKVSKTLIVSGVTLLITLVGLLIAVPLNKWVLSRKIGWALIALWTISTIFNVVIEVTGLLGDAESMFHIGQG
ncbi:Putative sodium/calcium exchanger membrane region, NCX, central ion-binding domain superfamily [Septoria linicola]|uniref:Sodium/calcium exchanger membrane region, NCX, central ion-binding domain superfamily n=1 Tax=Septoria linicola TaxID=215465 RepID=A0A9Q9B5J6_9PEZI|nr:Putative sodium/calcium exchanger membrane region, NCX, central ion-binding domain superfamily [Septoria linicola]